MRSWHRSTSSLRAIGQHIQIDARKLHQFLFHVGACIETGLCHSTREMNAFGLDLPKYFISAAKNHTNFVKTFPFFEYYPDKNGNYRTVLL